MACHEFAVLQALRVSAYGVNDARLPTAAGYRATPRRSADKFTQRPHRPPMAKPLWRIAPRGFACRARMLLLAVLLVAALLPRPLLASTPRLTALNAQANGPLSTLSLTLSEPVTYHVFALSNPDRIVIDLPELQLTSRNLPRDTAPSAPFVPGDPVPDSRLVIECTEPVTVAATNCARRSRAAVIR